MHLSHWFRADHLLRKDIGRVTNADAAFGGTPGLLVGVPSDSFFKFYIKIPSGYFVLVTSNGMLIKDPKTCSVVWSPGFHAAYPCMKISHLVTKGSTLFDIRCHNCKTIDNVSVTVEVGCLFRIMGDEELGEDPNLVTKFVHEVTPRLVIGVTFKFEELCGLVS